MNSFLSIYKVQTGVATPITIPDPIISYNFATTDVSGGNVRNTIDGTYDLNLKNGASVGVFNAKNCLILSNPTFTTNFTGQYAQLVNGNKYLTTSTTYTGVTYSFWVYNTTVGSVNNAFFSWGGSANTMVSAYGSGGVARLTMKGGSALRSTPSYFAAGNWYYVAAVVDSTSSTATMYVNTVSALTQAGPFVINGDRSANPLAIGGTSVYTSEPTINGYIANFRLYPTALTTQQINYIYSQGIQ